MNKLLFVDDEPNVISGLERQLNKLLPDCQIVGANSGIVKRFNGYVTVESAVGAGTTFHVHLPTAQSTVKVDNQEEKEESVEREKTNSVC